MIKLCVLIIGATCAALSFQVGAEDTGVSAALYEGLRRDNKAALKPCTNAAEQGHADAQYILGTMYRNGDGVSQDYVMAHMLYNVASATGSDAYRKVRDGIAELMTGEQIAEAQQLAREWMERHP